MPENVDRLNSKDAFERIIEAETASIDSDDVLGNLGQLKISEIVGENASENATSTGGQDDPSTSLKVASTQISGLIKGNGKVVAAKTLPTPVQQKKAVEAAIVRRTQRLVKKATKIQNSKKFSAHKLEEVLLEIRQLRKLLSGLWESTVDQVEQLYKRFVTRAEPSSTKSETIG